MKGVFVLTSLKSSFNSFCWQLTGMPWKSIRTRLVWLDIAMSSILPTSTPVDFVYGMVTAKVSGITPSCHAIIRNQWIFESEKITQVCIDYGSALHKLSIFDRWRHSSWSSWGGKVYYRRTYAIDFNRTKFDPVLENYSIFGIIMGNGWLVGLFGKTSKNKSVFFWLWCKAPGHG